MSQADNTPLPAADSVAPAAGNAVAPAQGLAPGPALSPPSQVPPAVVEQYKAKLADLGNLGTRQTAMTAYYVSILSALLGVLAFKDRELVDIDSAIIIVICSGGILVSMLWLTGINLFRALFRAKLKTLEEIEGALPFQTFGAEFQRMKAGGSNGWLYMERLVPVVFAVLFAFILYSRFSR